MVLRHKTHMAVLLRRDSIADNNSLTVHMYHPISMRNTLTVHSAVQYHEPNSTILKEISG
jgi:hypothetical protein